MSLSLISVLLREGSDGADLPQLFLMSLSAQIIPMIDSQCLISSNDNEILGVRGTLQRHKRFAQKLISDLGLRRALRSVKGGGMVRSQTGRK